MRRVPVQPDMGDLMGGVKALLRPCARFVLHHPAPVKVQNDNRPSEQVVLRGCKLTLQTQRRQTRADDRFCRHGQVKFQPQFAPLLLCFSAYFGHEFCL